MFAHSFESQGPVCHPASHDTCHPHFSVLPHVPFTPPLSFFFTCCSLPNCRLWCPLQDVNAMMNGAQDAAGGAPVGAGLRRTQSLSAILLKRPASGPPSPLLPRSVSSAGVLVPSVPPSVTRRLSSTDGKCHESAWGQRKHVTRLSLQDGGEIIVRRAQRR